MFTILCWCLACKQLNEGVAAIFSTSDSSILSSTANVKHMPTYLLPTDPVLTSNLVSLLVFFFELNLLY